MKDNNKYVFKAYNPIFPSLFTKEKKRLSQVQNVLRIEHVGSTAVPNLGGKGIIDIAAITNKSDMEMVSKQLQELGYEYRPGFSTSDRFHFTALLGDVEQENRTYHLHLMAKESKEFHDMILFRDYLIQHPQELKTYDQLKKQAALEANQSGEIYRKLKEPFIKKAYLLMNITLRKLTKSDFPLLQKWLENSHIKPLWDSQTLWTKEALEEKYDSYVQGYKLVNGQKKPIQAFIIYYADQPIGYIQYYNAHDFPREGYVLRNEIDEKELAGVDIYIGEQKALGKGLGSLALELLCRNYIWKNYSACLVDPNLDNLSAIKSYEKAGFQKRKTVNNFIQIMIKQISD